MPQCTQEQGASNLNVSWVMGYLLAKLNLWSWQSVWMFWRHTVFFAPALHLVWNRIQCNHTHTSLNVRDSLCQLLYSSGARSIIATKVKFRSSIHIFVYFKPYYRCRGRTVTFTILMIFPLSSTSILSPKHTGAMFRTSVRVPFYFQARTMPLCG